MLGFKNKSLMHDITGSDNKVACIGKLPMSNEFVKINAVSREIIDFYKWMQEGVVHMYRSGNISQFYGATEISIQHFVLMGFSGDNIMIGSMQKSNDKAGREYPVIILSSINVKSEFIDIISCVYHDFLQTTLDVLNSVKLDVSLSEFNEKLKGIDISKYNDCFDNKKISNDNFLKETRLFDFVESVSPNTGNQYAFNFFSYLKIQLTTIARRTSKRVDWGLRLPLSKEGDNSLTISFWIKLCTTFIGESNIRVNYSWSSTSHYSYLNIFFKQIPASYFDCVITNGRHGNLLVNVAVESQEHNRENEGVLEDCSLEEFICTFHLLENSHVCRI